MGLALTREVGDAGGSVAADDGGVGFSRITVAAGQRVASQEANKPGVRRLGAAEAPSLASPPHHGSLLLLQARFAISRGAL